MCKQGADAYVFHRVTRGQLSTTRSTGHKAEKSVWGEFNVLRGAQHLGTLFDVRHTINIVKFTREHRIKPVVVSAYEVTVGSK